MLIVPQITHASMRELMALMEMGAHRAAMLLAAAGEATAAARIDASNSLLKVFDENRYPVKIIIYAMLALLMVVKLIYDMSTVHDLVVALEGTALALMAVALHQAFKK